LVPERTRTIYHREKKIPERGEREKPEGGKPSKKKLKLTEKEKKRKNLQVGKEVVPPQAQQAQKSVVALKRKT